MAKVTTYTVTATEGANGTISKVTDPVEAGQSVTLTITPAEGYEVDKLTVNGEDKTSDIESLKYTFTVNEDTTVNVTFKATSTVNPDNPNPDNNDSETPAIPDDEQTV